MSEEKKKPTLFKVMEENVKVSRQDIQNPFKEQTVTTIFEKQNDDEDEITVAKSIFDEIVKDTE